MSAPRPHPVGARFSAAATTYMDLSDVQDRVARRLMDLLPTEKPADRVLDAGCGPGRLLALARARWPLARLEGVDVAAGMVAEARARFCDDPNVEILEADLRAFRPSAPYDAILSGSVLHWLRPFAPALEGLVALVRPGGLFAAAVMLEGTLEELHQARLAIAPHKAPAGHLPTWAQFEVAARGLAGFQVLQLEQERFVLELPSAGSLLRRLNGMGVTGGEVSRGSAALTRGELNRLASWYDERYRAGSAVPVSFVVGYLIGERASC